MEYLWINHGHIDFKSMPYRNSYRWWAGDYEYPVDRFAVSEGRIELPYINIVKEPVYNLSNLTNDWRDRYFSVVDEIAENVYKTAGTRTINLLYSGGVDSTTVYCALAKNPKFKEFVEQGRFKISLTSSSIQEYPELFYKEILPNVILQPLDYNKSMLDSNELLVTGDLGDFIIGNSDASKFPEFDLMDHYEDILVEVRKKGLRRYEELCACAVSQAPFKIESINQWLWWINQSYVYQIDLLRPYIWSTTSDYSQVGTNNKVFRFFYDDLMTTFSYEYMSTNPVYSTADSLRSLPKEYIFDYTKDVEYIHKTKVYSQRLTLRTVHKSHIFVSDGSIQDKLIAERTVYGTT
jgi:hypothetical protein